MNTIRITTPQNIDLEFELGSLGDRIVGGIIDNFILIAYAILILFVSNFTAMDFSASNVVFMIIFLVLPIVLYDLLIEIFLNGQSIGKKVMGIKVMSLNGQQPTLGQYLNRWVFRIIDFTFSGSLIALTMVAANERRQRLGDLIAGTVVVKTTSRTQFRHTFYEQVLENHVVVYPEVINLRDTDVELIKEVLVAVRQTGNTMLALQAQEKIEQTLHITSKQAEPKLFLEAILLDYVYVTSKM